MKLILTWTMMWVSMNSIPKCKPELKRSYVKLDYGSIISEEGESPSFGTLKTCPYLSKTCCAESEISSLAEAHDRATDLTESYFRKFLSNLSVVTLLKEENFPSFLKSINFEADGECFKFDEHFLRFTLFSIRKTVPLAKQLIKQYLVNSDLFFSGFVCSMCDPADHESISMDSNGRFRLKLDVVACQNHLYYLQHLAKLAELNHQIFQFSQLVLCKQAVNDINVIGRDYSRWLKEEVEAIRQCAKPSSRHLLLLNNKCSKMCTNDISLVSWSDPFDLLNISKFNSHVISHFLSNLKFQGSRSADVDFIALEVKKLRNSLNSAKSRNKIKIFATTRDGALDIANGDVELLEGAGINPFDNSMHIEGENIPAFALLALAALALWAI